MNKDYIKKGIKVKYVLERKKNTRLEKLIDVLMYFWSYQPIWGYFGIDVRKTHWLYIYIYIFSIVFSEFLHTVIYEVVYQIQINYTCSFKFKNFYQC